MLIIYFLLFLSRNLKLVAKFKLYMTFFNSLQFEIHLNTLPVVSPQLSKATHYNKK